MIADALARYARSHARIFEDRANTVGGSDVGQCARKTFFTKNEGDPDCGAVRNPDFAESWGATTRGSIFEDHFAIPALRERYGERLLLAGNEQRTFAVGFLSATPDALVVALDPDVLAPLGVPDIGGDGSLVVEIKTIDPRARLDGPKIEHVFQAQVQLGLLHELTSHRPEYAVVSYTDASFWDLVYEFPVRRDPAIFATAQQRAARILTATAVEQLPPEGWVTGARECEYCPFSRACGDERARVPLQATEQPDPAFVAEVAAMAREVRQLEVELDATTAAFRTAQLALKEALRARGFRRVVGDGVAVTWSAVRGRPAFDDKAIREAAATAGINIETFSTVSDPTDRLTIRVSP
jgi:hypothetical protein